MSMFATCKRRPEAGCCLFTSRMQMPSAQTPPQQPAIPAIPVEAPLAGCCVVRALLWKAGGFDSREKAVSRKCHSLKLYSYFESHQRPQAKIRFSGCHTLRCKSRTRWEAVHSTPHPAPHTCSINTGAESANLSAKVCKHLGTFRILMAHLRSGLFDSLTLVDF